MSLSTSQKSQKRIAWGVRVPLKDAERVRETLKQRKLFSKQLRAVKDDDFLIFLCQLNNPLRLCCGFVYVPLIHKQENFRDGLQSFLTPAEYRDAVKGFDTVGTIAIIEIPHGLEERNVR